MPLPYCIITLETILSTRSEMLKAKASYTLNVSRPEGDRATVKIRSEEGEFFPYDFLYGASSACFHSTLVEIRIKSKVETPSIKIVVTGEKRKETLTPLKWVNPGLPSLLK